MSVSHLTRIIMNIFSTKLSYMHFNPPEVVSHYREQLLQVGDNYSYVLDLRPNTCKS